MSENQKPNNEAQQPEDDEINLLDLLIVLVKHKKMILGVTFAAALLALGISLLLPNIYTATAKILPPQQGQSSASALLSQLGGGALGGLAGGALGIKNPNDLYLAMLKSRNITEKIAQRFELQKAYEAKTLTDTLKTLEQVSAIAAGKDGVITVDVDDKDPGRAAAMANAYIEELNKLMQTFALTDAAQRRQFFETQMKPAKDKLTDAEITLDRTPNTSLKYMDAIRDLKYQEGLYDILAKQFEMAKLDEAKDSPLIQVLDKAVAPEKKSKPKRSLIVLLSTLVAGFIGVLWAFIKEANEKAKENPEQAERMQTFRRYLWGKRA
jgi:tyrosine-protein kinase Etk/Wzc